MIEFLENSALPKIKDEIVNLRVSALFETYGNRYPFLSFWVQIDATEEITSIIYSLSGNFTLWASDACDTDELKMFLGTLCSGEIFCDIKTGEKLGLCLTDSLFAMKKECTTAHKNGEVLCFSDFEKAYSLLSKSNSDSILMPPFDEWYADTQSRINHSTAYLTVTENSVAVAGFITNNGALITGVAVKKDLQRSGLGKAVVQSLEERLNRENLFVVVKENNIPFYQKCGFKYFKSYGLWKMKGK